jgi:hypothetical protein
MRRGIGWKGDFGLLGSSEVSGGRLVAALSVSSQGLFVFPTTCLTSIQNSGKNKKPLTPDSLPEADDLNPES